MADETTIFALPDEVITIILSSPNLSFKDSLNFGETCTKFNTLVNSDQILWKEKSKTLFSIELYEIIQESNCADWLDNLKQYFSLKKCILYQLSLLSATLYWRKGEIFPDDVKKIFDLAMSSKISYLCCICILSDIIKKSRKATYDSSRPVDSPYTLTTMHYAKIALQYLIHFFLIVKWHHAEKQNAMQPEKVVHFFLQWIDTTRIHSEEETEKKVKLMVASVDKLLEQKHPLLSVKAAVREEWGQNLDDNKWELNDSMKILLATKKVIFEKNHMAVTREATVENLDLVNVSKTKCANAVLVTSLFSAVARRCGVRCDVIAFPDHLFLEWKESYTKSSPSYYINHINGDLEQKRRCPYSNPDSVRDYKYNAEELLLYLYTRFSKSMGAIRDWSLQNSYFLVDMLHNRNENVNPYNNFLNYLDIEVNMELPTPLHLKHVNCCYDIIAALMNLNHDWDKTCKPLEPKKRYGQVKFAVGMICYHMGYDYVCIIRDWDLVCMESLTWQQRMSVANLDKGSSQPFYTVIAADSSKRYVAQENLRVKANPSRMYTLEEQIARDFSHFDSYAYVPNREKESEYPDDSAVREFYRERNEVTRSSSLDVDPDHDISRCHRYLLKPQTRNYRHMLYF